MQDPVVSDTLSPETADATIEAIHAAKNAAQAVENARALQLQEAVEKTSARTKADVLDALKQIFQGPDEKDPEHMSIIYQKIPVLCVRVDAIDKNIEELKDSNKWAIRFILGGIGSILTAIIISILLRWYN